MTRLLARKMSMDAVPLGGGIQSALEYLMSGKLADGAKDALDWIDLKFKELREAQEPNPFKHQTDEWIAGELLARLQRRANKA